VHLAVRHAVGRPKLTEPAPGVQQDLDGHAADRLECSDVAAQERLQAEGDEELLVISLD
jgi:hypothetical protein